MYVWLILIGSSALTGFLTAHYIKKDWAIYFSGAVPWFGLLAAILYTEYTTPYQGGGASMWPVAQFFGGTAAAAIGVISFRISRRLLAAGNSSR